MLSQGTGPQQTHLDGFRCSFAASWPQKEGVVYCGCGLPEGLDFMLQTEGRCIFRPPSFPTDIATPFRRGALRRAVLFRHSTCLSPQVRLEGHADSPGKQSMWVATAAAESPGCLDSQIEWPGKWLCLTVTRAQGLSTRQDSGS